MKNDNIFTGTATGRLVIINIVIYILTLIAMKFNDEIFKLIFANFSLIPSLVVNDYKLWQFATYMFLHNPGSLLGTAIDIMILMSFGLVLEEIMGGIRFILYYIACGIGAGIGVFLVSFFSGAGFGIPFIGSSGAVLGLLFAFAAFFPEQQILFMFFIPLKAKYTILVYAIFFVVIDYFYGGPVSYFGQFGSLAVGFIYFRFLFDKDKARKSSMGKYAKKMQKIRETEGKSFIDKHDHPEKNNDLKKQILLHLRSNPDINSLNDDEFQFIKYIDIIIEKKNQVSYNSVQNLENISDEDFINEVRYLIKI